MSALTLGQRIAVYTAAGAVALYLLWLLCRAIGAGIAGYFRAKQLRCPMCGGDLDADGTTASGRIHATCSRCGRGGSFAFLVWQARALERQQRRSRLAP